MKTTLRIFTLAFILGLAGALTAAWGAESVVELITQGEASAAKMNSAKDALDAAMTKNNTLALEGNQIKAQQQQIQSEITAYKQKVDDVKTETDNYKTTCNGKQLNPDQYKACKAQIAQVNSDITAVNAEQKKLNKLQSDWQSRAVKYNQEVQTTPKEVREADNKYRTAMADQYQWLDKARDMVASPAFQPYAKKSGCPDVRKPAKTSEAAIKMSEDILACLKKVASMN
jgi:predicted  nucleic acid-binding Zn-ribbon protein